MRGRIYWGRLFRRTGAACLATVAIWGLLLGAGAASGAGVGEAFVTAALRTELGYSASDLPFWQRLAVEQSSLLAANPFPAPTPKQEQPLPDAQPAPDHDDLTEPPQTTTAPGDIVERTLIPSSSQGYDTGAGLYLYNRTNKEVDLSDVAAAPVGFTLAPAEEGPQILIYHSHATEAYTPDGTDIYTPSDNNTRTLEEGYNMLRVGDELERVFTEMGLSVLHDRGIYDYPTYNGSYTRSGPAVADYLAQYPTIKLVLDVHRDALVGSDGEIYKMVSTEAGEKVAQVMMVLGTDAGGAEHPRWRDNMAFALKLQRSLVKGYASLVRPTVLRKSRYNQQLSPGSILVEVGGHGNTLSEAIAGGRLWADNVARTLLEMKQ